MSVYKLTAGVVGLLLAAVVVTAVVGVATVFSGAGGRPRKSSRQQPIQFGLRARAVALRMPMAGTAGEASSTFVVRGRPEAPPGKALPIFVINFRSRSVERSIGSGGTVICISYGLRRMGTRLLARP